MNNNSCYFFVIAVFLVIFGGIADANLLLNPSFETGSSAPDDWETWEPGGTFEWYSGDARTGSKSVKIGGPLGLAMTWQRVIGASAGEIYQTSTWAKFASGSGNGTLKLEYHGVGSPGPKLQTTTNSFTATGTWTEISVSGEAPPNTDKVTAALVGESGGYVLFDDVTIELTGIAPPPEPDTVTYDVSNTSHEFLGFGAHIWGYGNTPGYPNLLSYRQQALEELNIKYIRLENSSEWASWSDMQATRAITDALGIKWVYDLGRAGRQRWPIYGRQRDA